MNGSSKNHRPSSDSSKKKKKSKPRREAVDFNFADMNMLPPDFGSSADAFGGAFSDGGMTPPTSPHAYGGGGGPLPPGMGGGFGGYGGPPHAGGEPPGFHFGGSPANFGGGAPPPLGGMMSNFGPVHTAHPGFPASGKSTNPYAGYVSRYAETLFRTHRFIYEDHMTETPRRSIGSHCAGHHCRSPLPR